jgi:hypothetical protein
VPSSRKPKALLLDEPFGALDALTRMTLQDALRDLIRQQGPTVVLVTHDVDEALFLADRIFVFSPRPAKVLKEFNLVHHEKTHDLSEFAATRREILCLLGIHAEQDEFAKTWKGLEYETRTHPGTGHRRRGPGFHRQCLCPGKIQDRLPARHGRCTAMAAYEAGLYKKYGLDVELIEFKSGTDLVKAIVGGQLDSGVFGFSNAVAWASKGADLKVVGGAQLGYHALVAREDSGINKVADLKGKTLASQAEGSTADTVLKGVVLRDAGVKPDDVNVMGVSPQVAVQSLVGKRVDAAFLFEPQAHRATDRAGQAGL